MQNQVIDILKNYFSDENKNGQDYACSAMLHDLARLVEFDIDSYVWENMMEIDNG